MATYYVDPVGGDNDNDGLSPAEAWATRAFAASAISAGDNVICMATGVDASANVNVDVNSYWFGANNQGVVDDTRYECASAATPESVFTVTAAVRVSFEHFHFSGASTPLISGVANVIIDLVNVLVDGGGAYAVITSNTGNSYGGSWLKTRVEGCTTAVFLAGSNRGGPNRFVDCRFVDNGAFLGQSFHNAGAANVYFFGCSFISTALPGSLYWSPVAVNCLFAASTLTIGDRLTANVPFIAVNCVFRGAGTAINWQSSNPTRPILLDYCCFYDNTTNLGLVPAGVTIGEHSITEDPQHTDPDEDDYSIGPDSPLVGAGLGGVDIGPSQHVALTPAQIAAAVWTREGRTLTG
jgi:hypothetical protein